MRGTEHSLTRHRSSDVYRVSYLHVYIPYGQRPTIKYAYLRRHETVLTT